MTVLDLHCWVEGGVVLPTRSPWEVLFCLMEDSAMDANTKWSTLSQEIICRMKNTSQRVCNTIWCEILIFHGEAPEKQLSGRVQKELAGCCHEVVHKDGEE